MAPQPGVNGVLPVSVLQKNAPTSAPRGPKAAQPRLKLVLRRLPPGLTKMEFESLLGDEWKLGAGRVDWLIYKPGKVSRDPVKPSRPSRAYLHVTSQSHVPTLGDHVRQTTFNDAAKSTQDAALIGPPSLEYAPYHRFPGGRRKTDNRQGTIDQDQEFKDFLEGLTNPITKPPGPEADAQKEKMVATTPLIEALREKKANKDKPQAKGARHGRGESKEDAAEKKVLSKASKEAAATGEKGRRPTKAEKAVKEAVKVLNKEASASKEATASPSTEKGSSATPSAASERKRGSTSIAKSMLQRDLGIGPAPTRRRGTKREVTPAPQDVGGQPEGSAASKQKAKEVSSAPTPAASREKTVPTSPKKPSRAERRAFKASLADKTNSRNASEESKAQTKSTAPPAPTILKKPQTTPTAPKGPAAARVPPTELAATRATSSPKTGSAKPDSSTAPRSQAPADSQASVSTNRQAFLKHANPSQGITEPLIEEALKIFGVIEKVEIDKRKGFAYVDFVEPDGLQKAIIASPIKVAQGAVQVLERKEKVMRNRPHLGPHGPPTGPSRGRGGFAGRGRGRGGVRGGGHISPHPSTAGEAGSAPPPATAPVSTPVTADVAT